MSDEAPDWRQMNGHEEQQEYEERIANKWPGVKAWPGRTKGNTVKSIASALVKAQREFGPALKTHTNPAFKSKYADLSACIEAVIDALNNNGIALIQQTHEDNSGVTVETLFVHESGETFSGGKLHVPASKQDPQGYGSALSYCRRYSLMAACGIAPEDDDGNAASKPRDLSKGGSVRHSPTQGALEALQDQERIDHLTLLGSVLVAMVDKGDVGKAYDKLIKEKLDDTEYTALWEILKGKPYVRTKLKAHADHLRKQREINQEAANAEQKEGATA